jgi:predicted P-loop ATPase
LISLIARVMEPGCKADFALVLEGPQGIFKSEVLRMLGRPWVTDDMGGSDPGSKDAAIQVACIWIFELAELDQFTLGRERDVSRTKSFMSRSTDRFRPPYGRHPVPQPRQCCFACTTNKREYLPDETGNRRWWPVVCTKIDLEQLNIDRDQLLGEAVALYEQGEPWWLDTPELNALAADEQEGRYTSDAWEEMIGDYIATLSSVSVPEILIDVIKLQPADWGQREQNRIVKCLRRLGWQQRRVTFEGKRQRRHYPPKPDEAGEK